MKRMLSLMLSLTLAAGLLAGCGQQKPTNTYKDQAPAAPPAAPVTLKIGQLPIVDGLPFWVAEQKKYYKEAGVNVELVTFKSANERDAAILGGQVDGMLADLVASTTLVASGSKVQVASLSLGATKAEGPMAILAAPGSGITEISQLKGAEIAMSTNSVMHYVLEKLLLENGFKPEEIKTTPIPQIPVRFETLMSGKVKAAILPDPLWSLAAAKGAKVLLNDADAKQNYSQSVIVLTEKALQEKADGVTRMFRAYNRAVYDIQQNPDSFKDLLVEKAGLPKEIKESYKVVPFSGAQAPKKEDVESVVKWLLDKQVIKSAVTYEQLVNTKVLPR